MLSAVIIGLELFRPTVGNPPTVFVGSEALKLCGKRLLEDGLESPEDGMELLPWRLVDVPADGNTDG